MFLSLKLCRSQADNLPNRHSNISEGPGITRQGNSKGHLSVQHPHDSAILWMCHSMEWLAHNVHYSSVHVCCTHLHIILHQVTTGPSTLNRSLSSLSWPSMVSVSRERSSQQSAQGLIDHQYLPRGL